jgi:hypothetical protein
MKTRTFVLILILVLAVLIISEGFASEKRITKRDYRFVSGTWINEEYNSSWKHAKLIMYPDGKINRYNRTSDSGIYESGSYIIVDKWKDSEGNRWYKMHIWSGEVVEGHPAYYELDKLSDSGKVWEWVLLGEEFPAEMDENHLWYHIYYRQE